MAPDWDLSVCGPFCSTAALNTSPTVYQAYCYFNAILNSMVCPYQSENISEGLKKNLKTELKNVIINKE